MRSAGTADTLRAMTPRQVLDLCGMKLHGPRAVDALLTFDVVFDTGWSTRLTVAHGVLHHGSRAEGDPDATITTSAYALASVANELSTLADEIDAGRMTVAGDRSAVERFLALLDQFELFFPIIEP